MTHGEDLPFDLKEVRTVFYDLHDPDKLEKAQEVLQQQVAAIEASTEPIRNPITAAREVTLLLESDDPRDQERGEILAAINDLRDEMRAQARRPALRGKSPYVRAEIARERLAKMLAGAGAHSLEEIIDRVEAPPDWAKGWLDEMVSAEKIFKVDGGYSSIPF